MGKFIKKMGKKGGKKRKNSEMSEKEMVEVLPPAKIVRQDTDADVYVKKVSPIRVLPMPYS